MAKKKDDIPEWVTDEIKNAKFGKPEQLTRNGYVLEVYDKDNKIDAQFYDAVEDGRTIVTLCLLYTSPSPRDLSTSRMPSSA